VRALCFAGFGALSPLGGDFRRVLAAVRGAEAAAEALRRDTAGVQDGVVAVHAAVDAQRGRAAALEARIGAVESAFAATAAGPPAFSAISKPPQGLLATDCEAAAAQARRWFWRRWLLALAVVLLLLLGAAVVRRLHRPARGVHGHLPMAAPGRWGSGHGGGKPGPGQLQPVPAADSGTTSLAVPVPAAHPAGRHSRPHVGALHPAPGQIAADGPPLAAAGGGSVAGSGRHAGGGRRRS
jgi:hypothetical protein